MDLCLFVCVFVCLFVVFGCLPGMQKVGGEVDLCLFVAFVCLFVAFFLFVCCIFFVPCMKQVGGEVDQHLSTHWLVAVHVARETNL